MTRHLSSFLSIVAVVLYIGVMSLWLSSQELGRYDTRASAMRGQRTSERENELGARSESKEATEHWLDAWERNSYRWSRTTGEEGAKK